MGKKKDYSPVMFGAVVLVGLYLTSSRNYLLFHSLAEMFSIAIAFCIFIIAWNSRRLIENTYLLFLGIAYLFVGTLDLVHSLAYPGMGVFAGPTTNAATQLWIAARYTESLSLLLAILFLGRRLRVNLVLLGYGAASFVFMASIFFWDAFPTCFVEGQGLTVFKKVSEYAISMVLFASVAALVRRRAHFHSRVLRLLIASVLLTIASELAFTLYTHPYGLSNLIGHFLKIVSFYLIYKALIETGLRQPYDLLFRELKQREEALRTSEHRYRTLFESTIVGILTVVPDGTIVSANDAVASMLGYEGRGELIGAPAETLWSDKAELTSATAEVMRTGYLIPREAALKTKHGVTIHTLASATVDRDTKGQPLGYTAIFTDITGRKKAEQALQKSEERYRTIFENTGTATLIMEQDTTISLVNTEFEELTGYSKAEVEGKKRWTEFIMENDLEKLQVDPGTQRIGSSGVGGDYELKIVDRQGNVKDMHVTVSAVPGTNKSVVSAMDITEIRRAEEITKRDKEMLERLVRKGSKELIEAHRELAEAKRLSGIGTLAATVAHELRNPLGVIQTAVYNIRRKRREPTLDTHLTNIEKKISEGDQIIRNLLRYSRIKPPQYEKTNLTEILSDSIVSAATRFSNQSVEVNTAIDSIEDDVIYVDVIQIKEIFDNILNNAYQAVVDKEGRIEITGKIGPDRAVSITFSDNGIGIDQEDLEQVFEPFFTKKTKGTGLGLTICRELVKLHGGSVEIHSKPGSGTTVTVTLPARRTEK